MYQKLYPLPETPCRARLALSRGPDVDEPDLVAWGRLSTAEIDLLLRAAECDHEDQEDVHALQRPQGFVCACYVRPRSDGE